MAKICVARTAGFCFGVQRAVELAMETARQCRPVYTLGPLIHNAHVIARLEEAGIFSVDQPEELPRGATVLIRAHGVARRVYEQLEERGAQVLDATCPFVEKIHRIVEQESRLGRDIVVIGSPQHPEVEGICGWCEHSAVFADEQQLQQALQEAPEKTKRAVSVVAQTTMRRETWKKCVEVLKKMCTNPEIFDTICSATDERQQEARSLAGQSDCMIVLGDRHSANTRRLYEISASLCANALLAEDAADLNGAADRWRGAQKIGITAGASTPAWIIKEVTEMMSEATKFETEAGENFAEMLEGSLKTLNTGDKFTGIVTQIGQTEIHVDLGVKQSGYIPISEMSDDPAYKVEENVHVGDEIEAIVMRVNDMEGTIALSKKKVDSLKGWETIEQAKEEKTIVEGVVVEENKGGVVAVSNGVRVFIPASHTGIPKGEPMSQLVKQKVRFRITETNRQRKRVVGSIRSVLNEERRAAAEKIWETIEVGNHYTGTVKSLTSYGAFVDIGGVDGMVHISELSWTRIKHPSDVVNVGDTIEVYVLAVDKENKKISLGHKRPEDNPWTIFTTQYAVNDVVTVKILKFMPFGAFAEIIPGVDGLIHISQIADRRIARPDEVLTIGQEVDALIIDIDMEKKKVSLSIRALLEDEDMGRPVEEETAAEEE